jgi:hypothetical protein
LIKELRYKYRSIQWFFQQAYKVRRGLNYMKEMNLTRTIVMLITSLAIVAVFFSPGLSAAFSSDPGEGELTQPVSYNIYAGQSILIGHLLVCNDAENVYVKYVLDEPGWVMLETHVEVGDVVDEIPQTDCFNPIPGHFSQGENYDLGAMVTEDEFSFTIGDQMTDYIIVIAAHAAVAHITDGTVDRSETAWTATEIGEEPFLGKNWATFVEYEIAPM